MYLVLGYFWFFFPHMDRWLGYEAVSNLPNLFTRHLIAQSSWEFLSKERFCSNGILEPKTEVNSLENPVAWTPVKDQLSEHEKVPDHGSTESTWSHRCTYKITWNQNGDRKRNWLSIQKTVLVCFLCACIYVPIQTGDIKRMRSSERKKKQGCGMKRVDENASFASGVSIYLTLSGQ